MWSRQFWVSLVTTVGCNMGTSSFLCCLCCWAMFLALSGTMVGVLLGVLAGMTLWIAAAMVLTQQKSEWLKNFFVGVVACVVVVQFIAIVLAFVTIRSSARYACGGDRKQCYSDTSACGCGKVIQADFHCDKYAVQCFPHKYSAHNFTANYLCGNFVTLRQRDEVKRIENGQMWRGFRSEDDCLNHEWDGQGTVTSTAESVAFCACFCIIFGCIPAIFASFFAQTKPYQATPHVELIKHVQRLI